MKNLKHKQASQNGIQVWLSN